MARHAVIGTATRGTTAPNRLRRVDRWLTGCQASRLRRAPDRPLVVDLGFGASPVTTVELAERLRRVRPDVDVVGLEIDPQRVERAARWARPGVSFARGGFELPVPDGRRPTVVRACNVLRQYDAGQVRPAWERMLRRVSDDGLLVDGTCDEAGRVASWVAVERGGPVSVTVSLRLGGLDVPSVVAERLPKVLIHRNVPGEPVHRFLAALDAAWAHAAPYRAYGARQRFLRTCALLEHEWPLLGGPARWRLGEVTVAWSALAPLPG